MTLATIGAPGWGSNGSVWGVRWSPLQPRLCQSWSWQRRPDAKVATPQGNRPFYRWLTRDSRALFPHLPERTRLFRLCTTPHDWPRVFVRSEEHTSELQSRFDLVCRLLLEKKKKNKIQLNLSTP